MFLGKKIISTFAQQACKSMCKEYKRVRVRLRSPLVASLLLRLMQEKLFIKMALCTSVGLILCRFSTCN